jgi:3-hydroxyacyl-CoA dehydrogenase
MSTEEPSMTPAPFRSAAVLGAGVMGAQIAAHLANAGLTVHLLDIAAEGNDRSAPARQALASAQKISPNPFFTSNRAELITPGNFEDDFGRLADVDWVIEAVIEQLDIKQQLMQRLETIVRDDTIVSTNTSGLPIHKISEGRGESFRKRFLGTHFFNPPRYLKLFEVIPTPDTDAFVLERVSWFARMHLGKGIVVAKDTPNFIGNRIGIYAAMQAMREVTEHGFSIEDVDLLTGTVVGHPRSATFRTADLVGLDTLAHVANNLYEGVENDESREAFRPPWLLLKLTERGALGAKTKHGFYKKHEGKILSIDPKSMEYVAPGKKRVDIESIKKAGSLPQRLRALYEDQGRVGEFFRRTTWDLLAYTARRLPEIADEVCDVDDALKLGFGWRMGPFATWETLGFQRVLDDMREQRLVIPTWIEEMERAGATSFYRVNPNTQGSWNPAASDYRDREAPRDEIDLNSVRDIRGELWSNKESALLDLGDGVALFEFRSKMNSIGKHVIEGLFHAIETVENGPWAGLVIGNAAEHFSVGANLAEMGMAVMQGHWPELEQAVSSFQQMGQRIRYASKPVLVATQGRVLGGACEMTMACAHPVCAAESYIGLVEIGAGLIPAGGGTMRMAAWAAEQAASPAPEHLAPFLRRAFETVAKAQVATSAEEAQSLGFMSPAGTIVMNGERRLWVAKREVIRLAEEGYRAPAVRTAIRVLGTPGRGPFDVGVAHLLQGGFVREHDAYVAGRIAWVITGGDLPGATWLHEQQLLDLEREVFLSLLGEKATQKQIAELLTRNQPMATKLAAKGLVSLTNVFRKKRSSTRP